VCFVELYEQVRDQVDFMVVYVKEAQPTDKWWLAESKTLEATYAMSGAMAWTDVAEPTTLGELQGVAGSCAETLFKNKVPLYVDTMDDRVSTMYTAKPTRIYLIGKDGDVVYNPGIGPCGYNPDHLGREIESYLSDGSTETEDGAT
jgi:hypothetical protein